MKIKDCEISEFESLSKYSSMKTGGIAKKIIFPLTEEGFKAALCTDDCLVFGNCSNVLFPDEGLNKTIILTTKLKNISFSEDEEYTYVKAEAGAPLTGVAAAASERSLTGLEFAYGIPGSVGGGVYMNAGAYNGEIKDVFHSCICSDKKGNITELFNKDMDFSYRHSILENSELILLSATFKLKKGDINEIKGKMKDLMERRITKQPLDRPSCGSFFKRPKDNYASALVDQCGLKGFTVGGAQISEKHAGFVINAGNATTADILELARQVTEIVKEKCGVTLEREVRVITE
jgi:UDP-N-acetylmuramate dehydrogenase